MAISITGGKWRGHRLAASRVAGVRPTSSLLRQALFDILQASVQGSQLLELFAGTGAISFEALSRGARAAVAVEKGSAALRALGRNAAQLGCKAALRVVAEDVFRALARANLGEGLFDWIFADPPYDIARQTDAMVSQLAMACSSHLKLGGLFFLERARRRPISGDWRGFEHLSSRTYGDSCLESFRRV